MEKRGFQIIFKILKWCLISSWKELCGMVSSDRGALKQVIHQVPRFLLFFHGKWNGSMLSQPGPCASENLYSSQDCFWPLFTESQWSVWVKQGKIKKNQMKAVSNVLTTFKTASRRFLKSNKFKLSFMDSQGQRDRWVRYLQGRSQGWFSLVVPQFLCNFYVLDFFIISYWPCQSVKTELVMRFCIAWAMLLGKGCLRPMRMVWVRRVVSSCAIMKSSLQVDISAWNVLVFEHPLTFLIVTVSYRIVKVGKDILNHGVQL